MSGLERGVHSTRTWLWAGVAIAIAALLFASGWAAQAVFAPAADLGENADVTALVEVREGSIEAHLDVVVDATWAVSSGTVNRSTGTITSLDFSSGAPLAAGDIAYTVDLLPVQVASGSVPMYRPLVEGTRGADVSQLQQLLTSLGYFTGMADGVFGPQTAGAVKEWQRSLGDDPTGGVDLGRVIFVPELPARLVAVDDFAVGDVVSGGETAFKVLSSTAAFVASVTENQVRRIDGGQVVEIDSPVGSVWRGLAGSITADPDSGGYRMPIGPVDGLSICGQECDLVAGDGSVASLHGRVVIQEELTGAVVATSAIRTRDDGTAVVFDANGDSIAVQVTASANGQSLVEGLEIGTEVRAPADREE